MKKKAVWQIDQSNFNFHETKKSDCVTAKNHQYSSSRFRSLNSIRQYALFWLVAWLAWSANSAIAQTSEIDVNYYLDRTEYTFYLVDSGSDRLDRLLQSALGIAISRWTGHPNTLSLKFSVGNAPYVQGSCSTQPENVSPHQLAVPILFSNSTCNGPLGSNNFGGHWYSTEIGGYDTGSFTVRIPHIHQIYLRSGADWDIYDGPWNQSKPDLARVLTHEIGHFLGLGHSSNPTHLMYGGNLTRDNIHPQTEEYELVGRLLPSRPSSATFNQGISWGTPIMPRFPDHTTSTTINPGCAEVNEYPHSSTTGKTDLGGFWLSPNEIIRQYYDELSWSSRPRSHREQLTIKIDAIGGLCFGSHVMTNVSSILKYIDGIFAGKADPYSNSESFYLGPTYVDRIELPLSSSAQLISYWIPTPSARIRVIPESDFTNTESLVGPEEMENWTGTFYNPSRSGEGANFSIEESVVGTQVTGKFGILTVYSYDPSGNQIFLIGSAALADFSNGSPGSLELPMQITSGGRFGANFNPADIVRKDWGTASLSFSCEEDTNGIRHPVIYMGLDPNNQHATFGSIGTKLRPILARGHPARNICDNGVN